MTTTKNTQATPRERMTALVNRTPLATLCQSLLMLDAKPTLDEPERLTMATIIDSICERSPAAEAAFQAWAESDLDNPHTAARVIVEAVTASLVKARMPWCDSETELAPF
jgi:hypothetical protein